MRAKSVEEKYKRGYKVTVVTYACGHTADFRDSPPKVKDISICLECLREVLVVSREVQKRTKREPPGTSLYDAYV